MNSVWHPQARLDEEVQLDFLLCGLRAKSVADQLENFVGVKLLTAYRVDSFPQLLEVKQIVHKCLHEHYLTQDQFQVFADLHLVASCSSSSFLEQGLD